MTGRRERVENLAKQRAGFEPLRRVFHPSHRPLEIAARFPHAHSPDDDDFSPISLPQQGTLEWPPKLRQTVKTQNPLKGELSHGIVS